MRAMRHCSVLKFLAYFQFAVPSVDLPEKGTAKVIQVELNSKKANEIAKTELENIGFAKAPYSTVMFIFHLTFATEHLSALGSWDEARRTTVRNVLDDASSNFHRHPRSWYDENPECAYDSLVLTSLYTFEWATDTRIRTAVWTTSGFWVCLWTRFLQEVVGIGLESPLFHIFSETFVPRPSEESGLFDEFPTWPVKLDQIPACLEGKAPDDCPDKKAGSFFRFRMFHVAGMPIVLLVGPDLQNAISCMIEANAVLMGCNTFGQVAGLLTKRISLFSTYCDGARTPDQYKTTPPLVMAERGYLWVPVSGSWRDLVLELTELVRGALNELMMTRVELQL